MVRSKVQTYLGFCIKARKVAYGATAVELLKREVHLILVCSSAAQNTFKLAIKYKNKFNCPLIVCKNGLENALNKPNLKLAAIRDAELAGAIVKNADDNFELYAEGNN
ncbi:MAG: hypothetical protein E7370_02085 [Clostridiales bacterium]|nr:hypothetical protein [Clostridiales bacterium]